MAKYVDYNFENCDCSCENCDSNEIIDSTDYQKINRELKDMGWIIIYLGEWKEFCCKECLETYKSNIKRGENNEK